MVIGRKSSATTEDCENATAFLRRATGRHKEPFIRHSCRSLAGCRAIDPLSILSPLRPKTADRGLLHCNCSIRIDTGEYGTSYAFFRVGTPGKEAVSIFPRFRGSCRSIFQTVSNASRIKVVSLSALRHPVLLPAISAIMLSSLLFLSTPAHSGQVTLAWDANTDSTLAGYRVYTGTASRSYSMEIDVGNSTSCVIKNLQDGATHYFAVTAVDASGLESGYSNEVSITFSSTGEIAQTPTASTETAPSNPGTSDSASSSPSTEGNGGGGGGGGGCFIATAAYGSYLDPHVMVLRSFRDRILLSNRPGTAFVRFYYANSPAIAAVIADSSLLKGVVRALLLPLVGFSYLCLAVGLLPAFFTAALLTCLIVVGIRSRRFLFAMIFSRPPGS